MLIFRYIGVAVCVLGAIPPFLRKEYSKKKRKEERKEDLRFLKKCKNNVFLFVKRLTFELL